MRSSLKQWCARSAVLAGLALAVCAGSAVAGSVSYTYDALGRLTQVTYSSGKIITYAYDAAGNRTSVVVSGTP